MGVSVAPIMWSFIGEEYIQIFDPYLYWVVSLITDLGKVFKIYACFIPMLWATECSQGSRCHQGGEGVTACFSSATQEESLLVLSGRWIVLTRCWDKVLQPALLVDVLSVVWISNLETWRRQDGRVEGLELTSSHENTKITTNCWTTTNKKD